MHWWRRRRTLVPAAFFRNGSPGIPFRRMRAIPATVRPVLFDGGLFLRYNKTNKERRFSMKTIITIGRQFGSGGKEIGIRVAKELGIPFYDKELLQEPPRRAACARRFLKTSTSGPRASCTPSPWIPICLPCPAAVWVTLWNNRCIWRLSTPSGTSRTKGLRYHRPVRGLRPGGLSQPPEPVYQRTSGGPYPARGPAAEPHAGEGPPADPQDRQAPGVLLRVLFLQEVGQCGQLPLLHRFQLSGPGPDRGADPGMVAHKEHPIPSPTEEDPTRPRT